MDTITSQRSSFLTAISEDRAYTDVRLIYADWLEEQGDEDEAARMRQTVEAVCPHEHIRSWMEGPFRLEMYLADWDDVNQPRISYEFYHDGRLLFAGSDYSPGTNCQDDDRAVAGCLAFLALRPGDTDADYFRDYTEDQLDFAKAHGEELSSCVEDLEFFADWPQADEVAAALEEWAGNLPDGDSWEGDGMDVRLQVLEDGGWDIRTGDSSWDDDHSGYWGEGLLPAEDYEELARDLLEQAKEQACWSR